MPDVLLSVSGLKTYFPDGNRWVRKTRWIKAVDGVDFQIEKGRVLGLVGESGSGKTTLGRSILRLVEPTEGSVLFDSVNLTGLTASRLRAYRRRMQIVFQDPYSALSPRMQVSQILSEPMLLHRMISRSQVEDKVVELLAKVGMEAYFRHRYPHEFSGGQRQRIAIARALASEPDFLVADEPVSALDVSVQAHILNLLIELQRRDNLTMLFISHDLAVVERIADRIAVMYQGKIVEEAPTDFLLREPRHPYTRRLLDAVPESRKRR